MSDREIRQLEKAKCRAQRSRNLKEEATVCNQLGELRAKCGRFQEAIEEHRQELEIGQGLGDVIGCAVANRKIGECFAELGNYEAALKHQRIHLDLAQSVSSDIEEQRALATIGRTYLYMSETGKAESQRPAEDAFLKSLAIVDERLEGNVSRRDVSEMRARLFLNLGFLYDIMGEADQCNFYIRKSIFISEQTQLHEDLYRANVNLAGIHLRNGEHSKAIRCWEAARGCARRMRDKYLESECYCSIGQTLLSLGDLSAGKRSLKKAFRLGSQQPSDRDVVRRNLKYALRGRRLEEELSELAEGDQQGALVLYEQLGDLYCKVTCYSKAAEYYKLQLGCAQALGRPDRETAVIHVSLAATYTDLRNYKEALLHYQAELKLRKGNSVEECKTWMNMAVSVEEDGGGLGEVQSCLVSALGCARKAEDTRLQRKVLRQLLVTQEKWSSPKAEDTKDQLAELCSGSHSESEEEEEHSEPLQESDIELSSSDEEEDLEGYEKTVPGRRRAVQWNRRNEKGETVLHRACMEGNTKLARCLLEKGHPLNPRDYCGWTPLHEACNHGHLEVVQMLLDGGANINDPGGPLCEGTTPLHDALTCGNFHVARLLIHRGASVTQRNAKGGTPQGSLQEWLQMYGKHLDQETRQECRDTERLLRAALTGGVAPPSQHKGHLQDGELFDAEGSQAGPVAPCRARNEESGTGSRRTSSSRERRVSSLEAEEEAPGWSTEGPLHEDDSEDLLTPLKPVKKKARFGPQKSPSSLEGVPGGSEVPDSPYPSSHHQPPEGGKAAYQRAIQSLGSAKSRIFGQSLAQPEVLHDDGSARAALVPAEEYLGDDWLEDDLRSRSRKRTPRSPTHAEMEGEESSDCEEEEPEERRRDHPPSRTPSLSRKRSRQTKLTQIVDRAIVGRTKNDVPRGTDTVRALSTPLDSGQPRPSSAPQMPPVTPPPPPPMRVRVRVQDDVFLIPIPHSGGETREISWLAEQASQRYYQSCGLRPRLTLKKEGALLDPQDLILYVLQSNEEVLAEVHSWDLPPLTDRYRKSCQSLGVQENRLLLKAVDQQEVGTCLSLRGLALKPRDLWPLLRAVKLQSSLRTLDLSGNFLGDPEMEELLATLSTIPHLTHLNLSCNQLTHEGVRRVVPGDGRPFQKLEELDLSLNPLGDGLTQPLATLIHHCPVLTSINLQACRLSSKFLQQYRPLLAEAFRGAVHMKSLSLSQNPLGSVGVELLLKTLPHDTISRLDLQAVTSGDGLLVESVVRFLSQDGCVLSHLVLSCNNLTDQSVQDLSRCLLVSSSLKTLDLSGNPKVGVKGLESLLYAIQESNQEREELLLTGCTIQGPLPKSLLEGVSSLLQELRLGSQSLSKKDRQTVTQAWGGETLVLCHHNKLFLRRRK